VVWSRQPRAEATQTAPTPEPLWVYDAAEVRGLRIEDLKGGKVVEVQRDPDVAWRLIQPDDEPADAGRVEQAVTWLRSPGVSRVLAGQEDLAVFGLADPATRVTLVLQDGTTRSFDVGAPTGIAGKTYIKVSGGDAIQVVSGYSLDDVTGLLDDPPIISPTPTLTPQAEPGGTDTPTATAQASVEAVTGGTATPGP
jgi:hypothetical protein